MDNIQKLHESFNSLNLPLTYKISEVDILLKYKYKAKEIDKTDVIDLQFDSHSDFDNIVKCYRIDNADVLNNLYTTTEIEMFKENAETVVDSSNMTEVEKNWQDIHLGKFIRIMITSQDGNFVRGFTFHGISEVLIRELMILRGIDQKYVQVGNPVYTQYLDLLNKSGYI